MKNVKKIFLVLGLGVMFIGNVGAMHGQKRNIGAQQGPPVPPVVPPVVPQQQNVVPVLVVPVVPNIQAQLRLNLQQRLLIAERELNIREALVQNVQDIQDVLREARELLGGKKN